MHMRQPLYLRYSISVCKIVSYACATTHRLLLFSGVINQPLYLFQSQGNHFQVLKKIWYARLVRRMLSALIRSPLRNDAFELVNFNVDLPSNKGCIILTCHTPWKRLLVQYCLERKFALIVSNVKWKHNKEQVRRTGEGFTGLRKIVDHINKGGRIIITIDAFNKLKNCLVKFQGKDLNVSLFPVRLASLTGAPIVVALPKLSNGKINFITNEEKLWESGQNDITFVVKKLVAFLETEINNDPSIWSEYVN